ncbi:SAM-dependent methyltransferase [Arthrobacter sp. CAN_A214]|uniref:class I SAM-dependent methyltransferase n=1 Tax=Arthrobacter sp. CAN_A214 TaxID=2787720 RepID=UPI0018C9A622
MTIVTNAYSRRAEEYIDLLGTMDAVHPLDRQLIDSWAATVSGRALDAGCGPGHWTSYLTARGLDIYGIDLVPSFLEHARSTYPGATFKLGSIDNLQERDGSLDGILSWYSTIHHEPSHIGVPIAEFSRTIRAGGVLLLGHFDGAKIEPFDHAVTRAYRWPAAELEAILEGHGFEVLETHRRTGQSHRPLGAIVARRESVPL